MALFKVIAFIFIMLPLSFAQMIGEAWLEGCRVVLGKAQKVLMNRNCYILLLCLGMWSIMCLGPLVIVLMCIFTVTTTCAVQCAYKDGFMGGGV